jgi:hypothetical protein
LNVIKYILGTSMFASTINGLCVPQSQISEIKMRAATKYI